MPIYFYSTIDEYGCLSNFSPQGIEMDGHFWPTVEHYFQAQKFTDEPHREKIRLAKNPKIAKQLGRSRKVPLRPDWEKVKVGIMREGLLKKFETHEEARIILLSTGDEKLIEKARGDYYWGCGADGSGKNQLGRLLMEVRKLLRDREE